MRPTLTVVLALPLLAGCGTPPGLAPLDRSPPEAERGLWEYDASGYLRYDGHPLGRLVVREPGQALEGRELEGERQQAGDFETRVRTLAREDGTTVDVLAVATLAEPAYFQAVTAQVASADVVVVAVRAKGDEAKATAAQARLARGTVAALGARVVYVGDALVSDGRWVRVKPEAKALARREAEAPDEEELDEAVLGLQELADEHGPEVVLQVIVVSRVRPRLGDGLARRGPIGEDGFALGQETDELAWEARTLRDATLEGLRPVLERPGRRAALLLPPATARAVAGALLTDGFTAKDERWLRAIRLVR